MSADTDPSNPPVLLYDGVCGVCNGAVRTILRFDRRGTLRFAALDSDYARDVIDRDREVDQIYNALFREFLTFMMEDPRNITPFMHMHFIAKNVERMGDHATSIAEWVIYLVTGERPDEARPKADMTSGMN